MILFKESAIPTNSIGFVHPWISTIDNHYFVNAALEGLERFFRLIRHRHAPTKSSTGTSEHVYLLVIFVRD